jgi:gamma-glutamyltranspeptidase/glutathione hydrolase
MEKGDVHIGFGIQEGWNQAQAQAQFVANIVDFGLNLQAAIEAPRFSKYSFPGCDVRVESRIPEAVRAELAKLGHLVKLLPAFSGSMGRGQAVMRDGNGVNYGASDPRGDGEAVPQGPPVLFDLRRDPPR